MPHDEEIPVLIVGGGLTGLSAAVFLAWQGVPSLLIERHAATSLHPKARAINPRSTELLRSVGMEEEVLKNRSAIADNTDLVHVETLAGQERARMPRSTQEDISSLSPCGWSLIDQNRLEPLLRDRAERSGCMVRFDNELISLSQDENGVTAQIREGESGQRRSVRAQYMIAADGSRSQVRELLGVTRQGPGTLSHLVSFFFKADLRPALRGRKMIACYVNNPNVVGTFMSLDGDMRWVFNVSYHPEKGEKAEEFTPERCARLVRLGVGVEELPVEIESTRLLPWEIAAWCVDKLRVGRVFLAGDAAHVMPPTGAFGASTGIQDAHNLAWKLALALRGADPSILDSYEAERGPVASLMVEQSMLRFDVREGRALADVTAKMLDELTMAFGYRYQDGSLVLSGESGPVEDPRSPSALPGSRAPHLPLQMNGQAISTLDLFSRSFVLLAGPHGQSWADAARAVAAETGLALDAYRVGPGGDLADPENRWCDRYGVTESGAVLVRPDGFIAWRAEEGAQAPRGVLDQVMRQLLKSSTQGHLARTN
jgi:putative polyketide hydroxylase